MVMVIASKSPREQSDRAKTSKSVRLDDRQGFDHKFNKTGFKCEAKRHLYYYYVKCYEQVLRGKEASSVLTRRDFSKYWRLAESSRLKPLPDGFRDFKEPEKIEMLSKLIEEQVDAGVGIVQQCEDVGIQVNRPGKMEVDEGSAADLGIQVNRPGKMEVDEGSAADLGIQVNRPGKMEVDEDSAADLGLEYSINETYDDSLQSLARNFQGLPTCLGHPEKFQQCVSELKRWASSYLDISMEVERWEQQGMLLITKLKDRDICEYLGVDSSNTLIRSRQEEIFSQLQEDIMIKDPPNQFRKVLMEGIGLQASYNSHASNFGKDVERGVGVFATTKLHVEQDPAVGPASSLIVPPDHCISEALKVTPSYTGRLKANLEDIYPRVTGDPQHQSSKAMPMMEVSHSQATDLWGNKQYMTMPHSGGNRASQIVPMGLSISAEPSAFERTTWEPAVEGSPSPLWTRHWPSPDRYEL